MSFKYRFRDLTDGWSRKKVLLTSSSSSSRNLPRIARDRRESTPKSENKVVSVSSETSQPISSAKTENTRSVKSSGSVVWEASSDMSCFLEDVNESCAMTDSCFRERSGKGVTLTCVRCEGSKVASKEHGTLWNRHCPNTPTIFLS